jgi:hypothetical protein
MDKAQQFLDRARHFASAFIAGTPALRDANLRPELLLIHAQTPPDFTGVEHSVEKFHGAALLSLGSEIAQIARTRFASIPMAYNGQNAGEGASVTGRTDEKLTPDVL